MDRADCNPWRPAKTVPQQGWDLNAEVQQRSQDDPVDHPIDPKTRRKQQDPGDLAQVVHRRSHRGCEKVLVRLQPGHHQPADRKDQDREQVQAHQLGGQRPALGIGKSGCDDFPDEGLCEEDDQPGRSRQ